MRKFLVSVALALLISGSVFVVPVLAYTLRASYTVSENSSISYDMLPIIHVNVSNQWMADNGFMNSSANDTRIETVGGLTKPHMVTDNRTLTAIALPANTQQNMFFTIGNSELPAMDIILGYGGYFTVSDNASLEPGDNFTIEMSGYFDTGTANPLWYKGSYFSINTTGVSNNVTATLQQPISSARLKFYNDDNVNPQHSNLYEFDFGIDGGWVSPTGFVDPDTEWLSETNIYDNDTGTAGQDQNIPVNSWGSFVELTVAAANYDSIRFWAGYKATEINTVDIDLYYGSAWHDFYQGAYPDVAWDEHSVSATGLSVGTDGVASSDVIAVSANETYMNLLINGVIQDSQALGGLSIPDSSDDVIVMGASVPYLDYYSYSVNGTEIVRYEPSSMIIGDTLADEVGGYDADITWGSNPAGVSVSMGSLVSSSQPDTAPAIDTDPIDVLQTAGGPRNWFGQPDLTVLATNPARPFVTILSDTTSMTESQAWILLGLTFVLFVLVGTARKVRGHHAITGVATCAAIFGVYYITVFPWWSLLFGGVAVVAGIISERSHSI